MLNRFERPDPTEVTESLTQHLQGVAIRGWSKALPHRTLIELKEQFSPYDREHVAKVQKTYRHFAEHGGLILGYDETFPDPVAFGLAANDVSGNPAVRWVKQHYRRDKVYAWVRHVCIDGVYQGRGNFYPLMKEVLGSPFFTAEQVPTAYIFNENKVALGAFANLGFAKDPAEQDPKILPNYFGSFQPVIQYRYAAESVESALAHTNLNP